MFVAYHSFILFIFVVAIVFAWQRISRLGSTAAADKARLLAFAYYSLSAWICWALQVVCLLASSLIYLRAGFFETTGLWLGVMYNALWTTAILSLYLRRHSRMSLTLPVLIAFSLVTLPLSYKTTILTSFVFAVIDGVIGAIIFAAFAIWIWQWSLSKILGTGFFVHGLTQSIWRSLWLTPAAKLQLSIVSGFSLWRIALLWAWVLLISTILQRREPFYQESMDDVQA